MSKELQRALVFLPCKVALLKPEQNATDKYRPVQEDITGSWSVLKVRRQ
jgi:hypothetical protein